MVTNGSMTPYKSQTNGVFFASSSWLRVQPETRGVDLQTWRCQIAISGMQKKYWVIGWFKVEKTAPILQPPIDYDYNFKKNIKTIKKTGNISKWWMIFPPSSWHSWKNINICRSVQREIHGFLYVKESVFGKSTLNHQSCLFNQFNPMDFEESWWLNPHFSGLNQLNPRFWVVSTFFARGFVGKKT